MANNNIEQRINYRRGSNGDKPTGPKPNGSKPPFNLDEWLEQLDPGGWQDEDNGDKRTERSTPPTPFGEETFGFPEYREYLDKLRPGAIPLSFPKFMDQIDMSPEWGRAPRKKEGVMKVVGDTSAWHKKYLRNFGYSREFLDGLKRDDLERLFDDIMVRASNKGRA